MIKIENTNTADTSKENITLLCPMMGTECQTNCAWYCDFSKGCAITALAEIMADSDISTISWR